MDYEDEIEGGLLLFWFKRVTSRTLFGMGFK